MALAMKLGDIRYFMNMPVSELLDFCSDYNELNREIRERMEEEMKHK